MDKRRRKKHQRSTEVFRSTGFADIRPASFAAHKGGKKTGIGPQVDTFDHLFGSSLSSQNSLRTRCLLGPSHLTPTSLEGCQSGMRRRCSLVAPLDDMNRDSYNDVTASILHHPLRLNRAFANQRPTNNCAKESPAGTTEFPPLDRVIRATGGRPPAYTCLVPMVIKTPEDVPSDIVWLGDPPPAADLFNCTEAARSRSEEASPYEATGQWTRDSAGGAICWLGDPALDPPPPPQQKCDDRRSNLRSNPFNSLQTRATAAGAAGRSCRIRDEVNGVIL